VNEDDTQGPIAVALARLTGTIDTGFAKLDGRLDVALERQITTERELRELKKKVTQLEAKMYKLAITAALLGGGGATGAYQLYA
jgi:hypothetical protein